MEVRARGRGRLGAMLFLVVALAFVVLLLARQWTSLEDVLDGLRDFEWSIRPGWLAAALVLATLDLVWMGSVWTRLFRRTGGSVPWWTGVRVWVLTNFGRYIPGKVWQLGGLAVYMRSRGASGAAALVSAVAFQIVALVTGFAVAVASVGLRWVAGGGSALAAAVLLAGALALGLHPAVLGLAARRLGRWLGESEVAVRLRAADIAGAALGMLVAWGVYGLGMFCMLRGLGVTWRGEDLGLLTGIFAASYVIGYAALIAPGGLVVREGAMAGLLAELGGLPVGVAGLTAVAARLWMVAAELLALVLVLAVPGARVRTEEPEE